MSKYVALTKKELLAAWMNGTHEIHINKMRMAKSTLNSLPQRKTMSISFHKTKKDQLQEERYTEIEKANRILLEKMSHIYNKTQLTPQNAMPRHSMNKHQRRSMLNKISAENGVQCSYRQSH
jgi:hypothetical protein